MSDWREITIGAEGDGLTVAGLAIWREDWRPTGAPPECLPHPAHPNQTHRFDIYEAGVGPSRIRFAAGELSHLVWGFYVYPEPLPD